jgi:hypothetical protein
MSVRIYSLLVVSCLTSGLTTGLIANQGILPTVYKIHSSRLILTENRSEGPIRKKKEVERTHIFLWK